MRVGIVGAGISGLAAARALNKAAHHAVLFEKNDVVGGRCATQQIGEYVFDPGASAITPRGHEIENVILRELPVDDLIKIEKPLYLLQSMRVSIPENVRTAPDRYTFKSGNVTLPKLLAAGLDVRLNTTIEGLEKTASGGYRMNGEDFDAVVLTLPIPQAATILWSLGESRPFANCRYRPCLSIMVGFAQEAPELHYEALLDPEQHNPLMWLSLESVKSPGRAPDGHTALVLQMSPSYSLANFAAPEERIVDDALDYLERLWGGGWRQPEVCAVKRWKYSQPDTVALFDTVNEPGAKLVIAGDGVLAGRIENAYDSGLKAAALLAAQGTVQAAG